jgi:hypothetical protein
MESVETAERLHLLAPGLLLFEIPPLDIASIAN